MSSSTITTVEKVNNSFIDIYTSGGKTYYYSISATDTNGVESFQSDIISVTPGPTFSMQSEEADHFGTVFVESNHIGLNGTGFTNFDASNSSVEFNYMPGYGGGKRTLKYRYALGNNDRTGSLVINGEQKALTMKGTDEWTNYVVDSIEIELESGFVNAIRFSANGSDFGNLDEITIVPEAITDLALDGEILPANYKLFQNYPNPFNPSTAINYHVPETGMVTIRIFDILGRTVSVLVNKIQKSGKWKIIWNGKNESNKTVSSGIYFYEMITKSYRSVKKMVVIR
jgi:hypothetical protein